MVRKNNDSTGSGSLMLVVRKNNDATGSGSLVGKNNQEKIYDGGRGRGSPEYHSPGNCYGLELYPLDWLGEGVIKDGAPHGDW